MMVKSLLSTRSWTRGSVMERWCINNCPFFTASSNSISGWVLPFLEGFWARGEHMGAEREPGLPRINQGLWGQAQTEEGTGEYRDFSYSKIPPGEKKETWTELQRRTSCQESSPRGRDQTTRVRSRSSGSSQHHVLHILQKKNAFSLGGTNNRSNRLLWRADVLDQVEGQRRGGPGARQTGQRQVLSGSAGCC